MTHKKLVINSVGIGLVKKYPFRGTLAHKIVYHCNKLLCTHSTNLAEVSV